MWQWRQPTIGDLSWLVECAAASTLRGRHGSFQACLEQHQFVVRALVNHHMGVDVLAARRHPQRLRRKWLDHVRAPRCQPDLAVHSSASHRCGRSGEALQGCFRIRNHERWVFCEIKFESLLKMRKSSKILTHRAVSAVPTFRIKLLSHRFPESPAANQECSEIHREDISIPGNAFNCQPSRRVPEEIWQHHWEFWEEKKLRNMWAKNHCNQYLCFSVRAREKSLDDRNCLMSLTIQVSGLVLKVAWQFPDHTRISVLDCELPKRGLLEDEESHTRLAVDQGNRSSYIAGWPLWTEHPHTSHFLVLAFMFNSVARDIGLKVFARVMSSMSHVVVRSDLPSTLHSALFTVSLIFYFILLIFVFILIFHVDVAGARSPVHFAEWGVWPFGQRRLSHWLWAQLLRRLPLLRDHWNFSSRSPPATRCPRTCMTRRSVTTPSAERSLHHCSLRSFENQRGRRQAHHSPEESLSSSQSLSVGHVRKGRPVVKPLDSQISSVQEIRRHNSSSEQIRTLLERQEEQILADCRAEIQKHEFQADYDRGSIQKLNEMIESQKWEIYRAHQGGRTTSTRSTNSSWTLIGTKSRTVWSSFEKSQLDGRIEAISRVLHSMGFQEEN